MTLMCRMILFVKDYFSDLQGIVFCLLVFLLLLQINKTHVFIKHMHWHLGQCNKYKQRVEESQSSAYHMTYVTSRLCCSVKRVHNTKFNRSV